MTVACSILSLTAVAAASFTPRTAAAQGTAPRSPIPWSSARPVRCSTPTAPPRGPTSSPGRWWASNRRPRERRQRLCRYADAHHEDHHLRHPAKLCRRGQVCSINYVGDGFADVMFTLSEGQRGGYLQYITDRAAWARLLPPRPSGPVNSVVTGTCDPAELAQLQTSTTRGRPPEARTGSRSRCRDSRRSAPGPRSRSRSRPRHHQHLDPDGARPAAMSALRERRSECNVRMSLAERCFPWTHEPRSER